MIYQLIFNFCKYFICLILLLLLLCQFSLKLYNIPWTEGNTSGVLCEFTNSATPLHNAPLSSDMLLMSSTSSSGSVVGSFSCVNFNHVVHAALFFVNNGFTFFSHLQWEGGFYIENVGAIRRHDDWWVRGYLYLDCNLSALPECISALNYQLQFENKILLFVIWWFHTIDHSIW